MKQCIVMIFIVALASCNAGNKNIKESQPSAVPTVPSATTPNLTERSSTENSLDTVSVDTENTVETGNNQSTPPVSDGADGSGSDITSPIIQNPSVGDYRQAFNDVLQREYIYRDLFEIHLNGYLSGGTQNSNSMNHRGAINVLYRYILEEDLASYQDPYDYTTTDAPNLSQLHADSYRRALLDNGTNPVVPMVYSQDTLPLFLTWEGVAHQPTVRILRLNGVGPTEEIIQSLAKYDEKIYDDTSGRYLLNHFDHKDIWLNSNRSQVQWVDEYPYSQDVRFKRDGTKVILLLSLHVEFYDTQTAQPFYRLIPMDRDHIKAHANDYTYVIRNTVER